MKSVILEIGREKLQYLYDNSDSYSNILIKLGLCPTGGSSRTTIRKYEKIINKSKFKKNSKKRSKKHFEELGKLSNKRKIPLEEMLTKDSIFSSKNYRKRIIEEGFLEYKCSICGNKGEWLNKKITLQLDHINGINNDNRLKNLRFLCPNCHSQTITYGSKNRVKERRIEKNRIKKNNLIEDRRKILNNIELNKHGWVEKVSSAWGVSHTQVRRWMKKYYPDINVYERNAPLV